MSSSVSVRLLLLLLLPAWVGGCTTAQAPAAPPVGQASPETSPTPPGDRFSAQRAWDDLRALTAIGPRVSGTEGAERARAYLRKQLSALGLEVKEVDTLRHIEGLPDVTLRHLSVTLPGASPLLFLLIGPYDSSRFDHFEFVGANDGASSAALLLELTRVLSQRSLPYTTRVVFLDGEGRADGDAQGPAAARWQGSAGLAAQMQASGDLARIRLLVAFHQVCDADLHIARDLSSDRIYREEFFRVARRLGRPESFPLDQGFESVPGSHLAFVKRGVRPVVMLSDTRYGGDQTPGAYAETAADTLDHCSADSLDAVGSVSVEALESIGRRLARIERFARQPLSGVERGASAKPATAVEGGASASPATAGGSAAPTSPATTGGSAAPTSPATAGGGAAPTSPATAGGGAAPTSPATKAAPAAGSELPATPSTGAGTTTAGPSPDGGPAPETSATSKTGAEPGGASTGETPGASTGEPTPSARTGADGGTEKPAPVIHLEAQGGLE